MRRRGEKTAITSPANTDVFEPSDDKVPIYTLRIEYWTRVQNYGSAFCATLAVLAHFLTSWPKRYSIGSTAHPWPVPPNAGGQWSDVSEMSHIESHMYCAACMCGAALLLEMVAVLARARPLERVAADGCRGGDLGRWAVCASENFKNEQLLPCQASMLMCGVYFILFLAYWVMSTGVLVHQDPVAGRPIMTLRYMEWVLAVPTLMIVTGRGFFRQPWRTVYPPVLLTVVYIWASWLALVIENSLLRWALVITSFVSYVLASVGQFLWMIDVGDAKVGRENTLLRRAKIMLLNVEVISFGIYGVVYLLGVFNIISPLVEQCLYTFGDATVKLVHSGAIVATHHYETRLFVQGLVLEAQRSATNLSRLFDTAHAPIFEIDANSQVTRWNGYMAKLTGRNATEMRGKRLQDEFAITLGTSQNLTEGGSRGGIEAVFLEGLAGKSVASVEIRILGANDQKGESKAVDMLLSINPVFEAGGKVSGVLGVGQDLTEITSYKALDARKARFMAVVSHELRSPLHGIIGLSDALCRGSGGGRGGGSVNDGDGQTLNSSGNRQVQMIHNCATRLLDLVNNIMQLSQMQQDKFRMVFKPTRLQDLVEEVILLLEFATDKQGKPLRNKEVTLVNEVDPYLPEIQADADRCAQVLYNLLNNAFKFTQRGFVRVTSSYDRKEKIVSLTVSDTGCGMASQALERVFESFEQYDDPQQREHDGLGIGLSIAREIVRCHGGEITLDSVLGKGSTFTCNFPRKQIAPSPQSNVRGLLGLDDSSAGQGTARSSSNSLSSEEESDSSGASSVLSHAEPISSSPAGVDAALRNCQHQPNTQKPVRRTYSLLQVVAGGARSGWQRHQNTPSATSTHRLRELTRRSSYSVPDRTAVSEDIMHHADEGIPTGSGHEQSCDGFAEFSHHGSPSQQTSRSRRKPLHSVNGEAAKPGAGGSALPPLLEAKPNDINITARQGLDEGVRRGGGTTKQKPLILSVDDDPVNQEVIKSMVSTLGVTLETVMGGMEALTYLQNNSRMPDAILLDWMMPGKSGMEVLRVIRSMGLSSGQLPVIMLSAKTEPSSIVQGLRGGANDYMVKPFHQEELVARLNTQLQVKFFLEEKVLADAHYSILSKIMPEHIIERLRYGEAPIHDSHDHVTILFSDIVQWTHIASVLSTAQVVTLLNDMFTQFDKLCETYGVMKVETIGDAYMVASGHQGEKDHALRIANFALAMHEAAAKVRMPQNNIKLALRVGMHSGPAFTGVVGQKVPRYCFFGDTVNVASRMESNGVPKCVNLSEAAYISMGLDQVSNLKEVFPDQRGDIEVKERGEIEVKGKGPMRCYLVVPQGVIVPPEKQKMAVPVALQNGTAENNTAEAVVLQPETDAKAKMMCELAALRRRVERAEAEAEEAEARRKIAEAKYAETAAAAEAKAKATLRQPPTRTPIVPCMLPTAAACGGISPVATSPSVASPTTTFWREKRGEGKSLRSPTSIPSSPSQLTVSYSNVSSPGCDNDSDALRLQLEHARLEVDIQTGRVVWLKGEVRRLSDIVERNQDDMQHLSFDLSSSKWSPPENKGSV